MKKKYLILVSAGIFLTFVLPAYAASFNPVGTWTIGGTYTIEVDYNGKEIKKTTDTFSDKNLIINSDKTATIDIDKYTFQGTWKNTGKKKINFTLDKKVIKKMLSKYLKDNFNDYIKNFDTDISVKKYQVVTQILSDNSMTGNGVIGVKCKITKNAVVTTIDIGTIDFTGTVVFTGVKK